MPNSLKTLWQHAQEAHERGDLASSQRFCEQILESDPNNADAHHLLGMLFAQQGQWETSLKHLRVSAMMDPNDATIQNHLGNAYKNKGDFTQAETAYLKAIELHDLYAQAHNNLGSLYHAEGRYDEALTHYAKAVNLQPDFTIAHINLGMLFLQRGDIPSAKLQFQNVLTLNPGSPLAHYHLGNLALHDNELDAAEKHYRDVLSIAPEHPETLNNLGVLALKRGHQQLAVDYFTKALAYDNDYYDARMNLASTFMQFHRYENAVSHYREGLKQKPNDLETHYNMGVALMSLGFLHEAISHYKLVLDQEPLHSASFTNLGAIYLRLGQPQDAEAAFLRSLELNPNQPSAEFMLKAIRGDTSPTTAPDEYVQNLFENYAMNFDQHLLQRLHYKIPEFCASAVEQYAKVSKAEWAVCDLGCGTGLSGQSIRPFAKYLVGIDLSQNMIDLAREKALYHELHCETLHTYLSSTDRQFDLVQAADVLGYVGDLESLFAEVKNVLKSGGLFVFSIEITEHYPYILESSVRFAHAIRYIKQLAEAQNWIWASDQTVPGRIQEEKPVMMQIIILRKP